MVVVATGRRWRSYREKGAAGLADHRKRCARTAKKQWTLAMSVSAKRTRQKVRRKRRPLLACGRKADLNSEEDESEK